MGWEVQRLLVLFFILARKREQSYLGLPMQIPGVAKIDSRLLLGSLLFGIGWWGIAGICPGPALVLAGTGNSDALVFLVAMLFGDRDLPDDARSWLI